MIIYKKILQTKLIFIFTLFTGLVFADSHDINEVLELIKKDIKTLEKAVYSNPSDTVSSSDNKKLSGNSEDVLTRHLLKLSEIENQFRELTNKFEEINFKLDKLSSRLSKVQADNQLRFQEIESFLSSDQKKDNKAFKKKVKTTEVLPGSSQPQDLGSISYKDTSSSETSQQIQSVDTTSTIVTETFQAEEAILPKETPEKQYDFATSFLKVLSSFFSSDDKKFSIS